MFNRLVDYFAPANRYRDADDHYHARIAVIFMLVIAAALAGFGFFQLLTDPWDSRSVAMMGAINLPLVLAIGLLLVAIRRRQCYIFATQAILAAGFVSAVFAVAYTGGPLNSPVVNIFLIFPVIAFLITHRRGGLIWAVIVLIAMFALCCAHYLGVPFPPMTAEMSPPQIRLQIWLYVFVATTGFVVFYEHNYQRLQTRRNRERADYQYLAHHDNLTGLPNRLTFNTSLENAIARSRTYNHSVLLFFIDLNDFKPINDCHGHHIGDRVLREIAARIRGALRDTDTVCRLGGDEFAAIVENVDHADARPLLATLQQRIAETIDVDKVSLHLSASIGVSHFPGGAGSIRELVLQADQAMYDAKSTGAGIKWATPDTPLSDTGQSQLSLLADVGQPPRSQQM